MVLPPSWVATGPGPGRRGRRHASIDRWRRAESDACVRPAPQRAGVHSVTVEKRSRRLWRPLFPRDHGHDRLQPLASLPRDETKVRASCACAGATGTPSERIVAIVTDNAQVLIASSMPWQWLGAKAIRTESWRKRRRGAYPD